MSLPRYFSDQAFVLKRLNYSEADRFVTLFTHHHGKLVALAKGVRKPTSRKAPHIETFTHVDLYFARTHNLPLITQAQTLTTFPHLKHHLATTRQAYHLAELLDRLLPEGEAFPQVFTDLLRVFEYLDLSHQLTQHHQDKLILDFQLKLLGQLGFGLPQRHDPQSIDSFIETILDRRLLAKKSLS